MLAHLTSEDSGSRRLLLRGYARHEVRLLGLLHRMLAGRLMDHRISREMLYWTLAYPAARWGIVGTPVAPGELEEFFSNATRAAVGPCRCRMAHGACSHAMETDIVVRTGFPIWTGLFPDEYREIEPEEALAICRDSHGAGLAQISYAHLELGGQGSVFVMCNCCGDGCLPLLTYKAYGAGRYPFHRGNLSAVVDSSVCEGCAVCVEACPFGARSLAADGKARVEGCYGCGLCVSHCPSGASSYR